MLKKRPNAPVELGPTMLVCHIALAPSAPRRKQPHGTCLPTSASPHSPYNHRAVVEGHGSCGLSGTADCFRGWPGSAGARHPTVALFYNVELGWYLHYLIKHELGGSNCTGSTSSAQVE